MAPPSLGRILVVDDERDLAETLEGNFSRHNHDVTAITSARQALEMIAKQDFALLLTDIMMPEMGLQLLQEAIQVDPQLVGIIVTGQATVQSAIEAMKIGASITCSSRCSSIMSCRCWLAL